MLNTIIKINSRINKISKSKRSNKNVLSKLSVTVAVIMVLSAVMTVPAFAVNQFQVTNEAIRDLIFPQSGKENATPPAEPDAAQPISPANVTVNSGVAEMTDDMRTALAAVKIYFEIDEKVYTQFNYNFYEAPDIKDSQWNLSWTSDDYQKRIDAGVSNDGKIFYYNRYEYSEDPSFVGRTSAFAKISKAEARRISDELVKKIIGSESANYKLVSNAISYPSDSYFLQYTYAKNGYEFSQYQIFTAVDKITGEIKSFSVSPAYYVNGQDFVFENAAEIISKEAAVKSYLDNIGLELKYVSSFDYRTQKLTVKPVYAVKNNFNNEFISANNGKLIRVEYADPYMMTGKGASEMGGMSGAAPAAVNEDRAAVAGGGEVSFSSAELAKLESIKDYITSDRALEILADVLGMTVDEIKNLKPNVNLGKNYINQNQYAWNINIYSSSEDGKHLSIGGEIDARNGNVLSYYQNEYYDYYMGRSGESNYVYSYDEAKKIVSDKIKALSPYSIDAHFEFADYYYPPVMPLNDNDAGDTNETGKESGYTFNFVRKVNGIPFQDNGIYVYFDNITGKISSYRFTWYEGVNFPKLDNIITEETAFSTILDYTDFAVRYVSNGFTQNNKVNVSLVYDFKNSYPQYVDAHTGKYINTWDFTETAIDVYTNLEPEYQDLKGHWSEKTVKTLTENGIYVWGGDTFDPDKQITKGELIKYLDFYKRSYDYSYRYANSTAIFKYPEVPMNDYAAANDKDGNKPLTRQEAAQIICEYIGYGELGRKYDIFNYPFDADAQYSDDKYKGYITVIHSFRLIAPEIIGDDSNYEAKSPMTRAESASVLYNMIVALTSSK